MRSTGILLIRSCWVTLLIWQLAWHTGFPEPLGNQSWVLALVAFVPLLPLTPGVWRHQGRSLTWAMFLVMLYFIVGVMEAWSNPPQRYPALFQVLLSCGFFAGLILINRPQPPRT